MNQQPASLSLHTLLTLAAFVSPAAAQRLLGLDDGAASGPAGVVQIHAIDPRFCDVPAVCVPISGGAPISSIATREGGIAYDRRDGSRWLTAGPTLHRESADCIEMCMWSIPSPAWTGLSFKVAPATLFFTTEISFGEVPVPASPCGTWLDMAAATVRPAMPPLTGPLTGIEYDPDSNRVWLLDCYGNVALVDRPSVGGAVHFHFNVMGMCPGFVGETAGIALDQTRTAPGHVPGVLFVSDGANNLVKVDRAGVPIECCELSAVAPQLCGLALRPPVAATVYGTGSAEPGGVVPTIVEGGFAVVGAGSYSLGIRNAPPGSAGFMAVGLQPNQLPFAHGTLLVDPTLVLGPAVLTAGVGGIGAADFPLPLPALLQLRGLHLFAQGLIIIGSPTGIRTTAGLDIEIE